MVPSASKSIVFFHPDLGIGGAERLILDAALALQSKGHKITIFTSHCDPTHCFDEARDGTLDVRIRGNTIFPATLLGRFKILFSILRQLHLIISTTILGELARLKPDAFFIDQLAAGIPLLRWRWPETRILFYCHFPDLLLVQNRSRWWKRIWRLPFDGLEGWGMKGADKIVVNSNFTKGVVEDVWPALARKKHGAQAIGVVYPCVDTKDAGKNKEKGSGSVDVRTADGELWKGKKMILSINRFERKKNIGLAIHAFHGLESDHRQGIRLVVAGGYDPRIEENVRYHQELVKLVEILGLRSATAKNVVTALNIPDDIEVLFLLSVPAQLKTMLLSAARLLVYTPTNEHFGIVPLEAMLAGVPVLAADSGGPLETVLEGQTGWLRSAEDVSQWTEVMQRVLHGLSEEKLRTMGHAGKRWVKSEFSETKMADRLDEEITWMVDSPRRRVLELADLLLGLGMAVPVVAALYVIVFRVFESLKS
ncbi:MAG: hypothetical protein L6R38_001144 [Xanthoria sp. 2 TBL-2021]|nr:MAG: hypothetical protein L6R38_001144 [Xanthoria sp. 2 TBL-2021]